MVLGNAQCTGHTNRQVGLKAERTTLRGVLCVSKAALCCTALDCTALYGRTAACPAKLHGPLRWTRLGLDCVSGVVQGRMGVTPRTIAAEQCAYSVGSVVYWLM